MTGRTILHYQVLEKLGAGGMGEIFKARDPRLNRTVAIKALTSSAIADPDRRRRFIQEAQAASGLNHPNIITIHDILSEGESEYMVMEYVTGKTLADLIPAGGLGVDKTLRYGVQIADALAAAHAAGIVHRDLKPGNVMVTESGLVKILDFGLAKVSMAASLTEETQTLGTPMTVEGSILGTVSYMSPEQAQGGKVDARSDIFSFGALLYEMLTGCKAFSGPSPLATLTAILRDEVQPIRDVTPDCPPELEEIVGRALRKAPSDRWQTMQEVHGVLAALRQKFESGILLPPSSPPAPRAKKSSRALPVAFAGLAAVAIAGWYFSTRKAPAPAPTAPPAVQAPVTQAPPPAPIANDKPSPIAEPPKPESAAPKAEGALTNQSVIELAQAKVPEMVVVSQIRSAKATRFDLSTAGIIQLTKAGVPAAVIEAMRHPSGADANPRAAATPAVPAPAVPAPAVPAPSAVNASAKMAPLIGGVPFEITLTDAVPMEPEPGSTLRFQVTSDVKVAGAVVIAKGTPLTGEVVTGKKGILGRGGKPAFRLNEVTAVDGSKVKIKASPGRTGDKNERNIEPPGHRGKDLLAPAGSSYLAYFDGDQAVAVKR